MSSVRIVTDSTADIPAKLVSDLGIGVVPCQVYFGGKTFREISEATGESIDTLTARKRYALRNLSRALKHWIDE